MNFARVLFASFLTSVAVSTIVLIVLSACTTPTKYEQEKAKLAKADQERLDEYRAELEIGRNMAGRLLQFYGTQPETSVIRYVNELGQLVAKNSDYPDRKYMFQIISSDIVNAFACPGGYILITRGTLMHAKNEAELAAVLGHEIAHVGKKHMFDKLKSMSEKEMEVANKAGKGRLKRDPAAAARRRPKPVANDTMEKLARYLSGSAAGLNILKAAGAGMGVMLESGLGAEKEFEADTEGVRYAVRTGYDPYALSSFLCRLKKGKFRRGECSLARQKKKKKSILDKTHPPVTARLSGIDKVLDELDAKNIVGASGQKRFRKFSRRVRKS